MAKKKMSKFKKFCKSTLGLITLGVVCAAFLVIVSWLLPSAIVASSKQNEYVEKWGETSLDELPGPGVAWTYICIDYGMISGYDDVKITKGTHFAYGESYNYLKYTFKANGTRYVCIYKITSSPEYEVK